MLQFGDNFNRSDSATVGGVWTESDANGVLSISGNKLRLNKSADNNGYLIYTKTVALPAIVCCTFECVTLNNTSVFAMGIRGGGTAETAYRDSFGVGIIPRSGGTGYWWLDAAFEGSMTSFTLTAGHNYNVELIVKADFSREIRIWEIGGARPATATGTAAAKTPTADGGDIRIGYDNGSVNASDHKLNFFRVIEKVKFINGMDFCSIKELNGISLELTKNINGI
jgi:hypothetical protein